MKAFRSSFFMRALVWTLSFLLVWEPYALSAGKATKGMGDELKEYLEFTHLTQKRLTVRELYYKSYGFLPKHVREELKPMVEKMGDYLLPKFDVTKVTGSDGKESYQISANQDGKSVAFTVMTPSANNDNSFLRVNGHNISAQKMTSVSQVLTQFGLSPAEVKQVTAGPTPTVATNRNPSSISTGLLTARQVQQLNPAQKKQYFKQLRDLLQAMEQTQNFFSHHQSSAKTAAKNQYGVLFALLGEKAWADDSEAESCVIAGNMSHLVKSDQRTNSNGVTGSGYSCGSDGHGGVLPELKGNCGDGQVLCNSVVYGSDHDSDHCVAVAADSTRLCNAVEQNQKDIPDLAQNKTQFDDLKAKAEAKAKELVSMCSTAKYSSPEINNDQMETCRVLKYRLSVIQSWCASPASVAKYPKACSVPVAEKPPVAAPAPVAAPTPPAEQPPVAAQPPVDDGKIHCDNLPANMSLNQNFCSGGPGGVENSSCMDGDHAKSAYLCACDNQKPVIDKMKCGDVEKTADAGDGRYHSPRHHEKKEHEAPKGPNWWIIAGAGLAGLMLFYWISKSTVNAGYQQLNNAIFNPANTGTGSLPVPRTGVQ